MRRCCNPICNEKFQDNAIKVCPKCGDATMDPYAEMYDGPPVQFAPREATPEEIVRMSEEVFTIEIDAEEVHMSQYDNHATAPLDCTSFVIQGPVQELQRAYAGLQKIEVEEGGVMVVHHDGKVVGVSLDQQAKSTKDAIVCLRRAHNSILNDKD